MITHARWLMGTAALFNFSVVLCFLFLNTQFSALLQLDSATGSNLAMRDLALALIATFGAAYLYAAIDPVRGRPYIALGALGKSLAALTIFAHWFAGSIDWQLPLLLVGDVLYSLLFIHFLRRY
ncbi:hypothetical protein N5E31_03900 [Pseudomonas chengduensis]|uniref:hypothetical protein n=1 Tax=Pseudomonas sediminis TaxID=1691904 RepID=UPI00244A442A|nr:MULTISPECIES: hypothetical protein [Pseudomonas]MDG9757905.1 hypothetical protein [Pseudomonas sediminis]MDH0624849.1 hypothetical protein [Pseudomonas chengduensis]MDH1664616.1 hypothetical protein [Pseudomonas chengduensis]